MSAITKAGKGSNKPNKKKGKKKSNKKKEDKSSPWAWKSVAPKLDEPKTKTVNGKVYHWCLHHKKWNIHSNDECDLGKKDGDKNETVIADQSLLGTLKSILEEEEGQE